LVTEVSRRPAVGTRTPRWWTLYVCLLALGVAGYFVVPDDDVWITGWQVGVGYLGVAGILVGVRRQPAGARLPWLLFAVGVAANVTGIAINTYWYLIMTMPNHPPTLGDPFFLMLYPATAVGLALLIARGQSRRDWAALVDSTTITTGLGLLAWVFAIQPVAADVTVPLISRATIVAYPVGDIVLLAMTVRLVRGNGARGVSFWCLTGSLLSFLLGDATWVVVNYLGLELPMLQVRLVSAVFLVAFGLFGAAALHPTAREMGMPAPPRPPRLSPLQLAALTVASLIAPGILAFEVLSGEVTDGMAIVIGSTTLFLLVVTRLAQLLRQVDQQIRAVRELARHDELTGLPNRRAWNDELPRALERSRRDQIPACVALLDLDHFKVFNDTYGHPAGDRLLKATTAAWHDRLRAVDMLARYGGEEFIVLLPATAADGAHELLTALLEVTPLGQSFSAGVAQWDGTETSDALIGRADAALYQAKAAGRKRVVVAPGAGSPQRSAAQSS
jgi:diguanylate cyclase (GGDEF)-like protein